MTPSMDGPTATQEHARVMFNQPHDPNEHRYDINEQSTALVRYAPDFRTDPFYHRVLQHMQLGEWQQAVMLLNALTDKYPKALELNWLLQDAAVRSEVEQNWGDKVKGRSDTSVNLMPLLAKIAAVALIAILVAGGAWAFMVYRSSSQAKAERLAVLSNAQTAMTESRFSDAILLFDTLLTINVQDPQAVSGKEEAQKQLVLQEEYALAVASFEAGQTEQALEQLTALQIKAPGYKDVATRIEAIQSDISTRKIFEVAEAAFKEQKWSEALKQYESIREINSSYQEKLVTDHMVIAYVTLGQQAVNERPVEGNDLTVIQEYFRKALRLKTGDEVAGTENSLLEKYLTASRQLAQSGLDQALVNLKSIYDARPMYLGGLVLEQLYNTYIALGDRAEAAGEYESALNYYRQAMEMPVADKSLAVKMVTKVSVAMAPTPTPTPEPTPLPQSVTNASSAYAGGGGNGGDSTGGFAIADKPLTAYRGWILFQRDGGYYIMKADGSSQLLAPEGADEKFQPFYNQRQWSADGKTQAYVSKNWDGSDKAEIWKFRADLPENWRRNFEIRTAPGLQYDPAWSVNNLIAFTSNETGNDEIFVMDPDAGGLRQLTKNTWEWDKHPTWTADGSRIIFFSNRTGKSQIWSMNPDGSSQVNISKSEYDDANPVLIR